MTLDRNEANNSSFAPRLILVAAACVIIAGALTGTPLKSANDRSRWATVWSLVHRNTWQIDEIDQDPHWSTIDKVRHRTADDQPWHFYSSKPPLLSAIVAGVYQVERHLFGVDLRRSPVEVTRSILVLINALPMVLALWLLQQTLRRLDLSTATQCCVLLLAGFGSMLNPYLTVLNNHTPAAVCLLICLTTIIRMQQSNNPSAGDFALVGLTAAFTCCFELPAALFGVISFFWVLKLDVRRTLVFYVPAAMVPLAAYFITNWLVTGGIRPFYAYYGTDKYLYEHHGVPSYWVNPQGLDANSESPVRYLFHCVLGHHGLLSHTPLFLLSIVGWLSFRRRPARPGLQGILPIGAFVTLVVLGFYLTRTQNYNYGGNSAALRWMLWVTPFFWFALLNPLERLLASRSGRRVAGLLLALSIVTATTSLPWPWKPSWIYGAMSQAGWIDYQTPPPPFEVTRHSVFLSWPKQENVTGRWTSNDGRMLELSSRGHSETNGRLTCDVSVRLTWQEDGTPRDLQTAHCRILLDLFAKGDAIEDWLQEVSANGKTRTASQWLRNLFRGLPQTRAYSPSGIRYFQAMPDSPGYRCERGASRVLQEQSGAGRCWFRCDVWYCNDVPFGVLRWKQSVTRESTRELIQTTTWTSRILNSEQSEPSD